MRAVAKCPKINLGYRGYQIPSLLDSGSDVSLIRQSYFNENLMHFVRAHSGEKSEVHTLFHLMAANDEQLPFTKYVELDLNFMGPIVPKVGILVLRDPNQLLDPRYWTRLPGVVGRNLVCLSFKQFIKLYGTSFWFIWLPKWCEPIAVFSTSCVLLYGCLHHPDIRHTHCPKKHL